MTVSPESEARLVGGRYEIVRPLASGGMAVVYVARHHLTRQEVALKVIAAPFARDEAGVARFLREVSVASRIGHPGVVRVYDAGFDEELGSPYLAMELLEGRSLAQLLSERRVHQGEAMRYVLAMLEPLAAAHDAGVVHRDLKPENVFVARTPTGEVVKLLDFGVARDLRGSRTATMEGTALGTVYYMAPEQALDARAVTATADIYAMGVILYQVLCGIFPFDGTTPHAIIIRANRELAVPVAERAPGVDPRLAELVDRCLAKDPNERPADAATLRGLLAPLLELPEVSAWLATRPVNPATFLSTPPPPPTSSREFDDPFAPRPSALPPAPRAATQAAAPEVALGPTASVVVPPQAADTPTTPRRRVALWIAAALVPVALTAAALLSRSAPPRDAAPPATSQPVAPAPAPVAAPAPAPTLVAPAPAPAPAPTLAAPTPTVPAPSRGRERPSPNEARPSRAAPTVAAPAAPPPEPVVPAAPPPAPVAPPPAPVAQSPVAPPPAVAAPTPVAPPRPPPPATPPAQETPHAPPPFVSF